MKYIFITILLVAGIILILSRNKSVEAPQKAIKTVNVESENEVYSTQTKSLGAVEVEITPIKLKPGQPVQFSLSLDTHSVDLSYDYTKIISAQDDQGNVYKALNWSGENSGHHLNGVLEFEPLSKEAQSIKLNVSGIDNQDTIFEWEL